MSRRAQRMDFVFDENTGKPTSAKQYEFHSLTENLSLTENFVFATKDAQIVESMERQEKINAKRLHEIESEVSRLSSLLIQSSDDLAVDEQQLFEASHIKAAEIAETFATDEQMAVERIESVVQGQAVRTKHYETQLLSFKQATQQLRQEISAGKSLRDDQEKEAVDLAASISSLRIKDASVRRLSELGSEALRVAAGKLEQVKLVEQKREAKLVILRAQRDQVLTRLEKINKERIAVLAKVNEIRSGILERRDQHRREVESIQEQINSEQHECDNMLRGEKKSLNQLRVLDERTLTNEIDQNCAILAELQIAENQNAEAKAAKDADLAQVQNTQLSSAEELREAETKLEAIQAELAQVIAEAEDLEAAQAQELEAAQSEAADLEKKLSREQKAEAKSSKAALKKIRARQAKIQQSVAKISQYAPGDEEQTLIDEILEEDRLAHEMLQKEQEQQEQARIREQAAEQAAEKKKQKAKKAAEAAEARAAEKQRRKEAEAERAQAEEEERQQAQTEAEAKAAEEQAKAAEAAADAAKAQAIEEERLRAEELERIQKEKAEIEAARAELEAARAAKAQAEAEKAQEEEERAEEERVRLGEEDRSAKDVEATEEKEQYNAADQDDEYDPDQPPRKIMNVAKVRTARKPAPAVTPKKQEAKRSTPIKPIKPAAAFKQAAPVPSVRKPAVSHTFSAKEAAPVPRATFSKVSSVKATKPAETRKAKTQPAPEYDVPMTSVAADRINKRKLETQTLNASKKTKFDTSQPCDAAKRLAALLDAMPSSQGKSKTTPTKSSPAKVTPPAKKPLAKASSVANKRPDSNSTFQSYMNRIKAL